MGFPKLAVQNPFAISFRTRHPSRSWFIKNFSLVLNLIQLAHRINVSNSLTIYVAVNDFSFGWTLLVLCSNIRDQLGLRINQYLAYFGHWDWTLNYINELCYLCFNCQWWRRWTVAICCESYIRIICVQSWPVPAVKGLPLIAIWILKHPKRPWNKIKESQTSGRCLTAERCEMQPSNEYLQTTTVRLGYSYIVFGLASKSR